MDKSWFLQQKSLENIPRWKHIPEAHVSLAFVAEFYIIFISAY
jgi:hypothetical protein